jgi:two-component system, OmpR family, heavy metal sensor histidine kinase CusS
MGRISLVSRVTIFIGITFTICVVSLGFVMQRSITEHFAEQDADEYVVMKEAIDQAIRQNPAVVSGDEFNQRMEGAISGHHGVFFGVYSATGDKLYMMPGPDLSQALANVSPVDVILPSNLYQWSDGSGDYRGVVVNSKWGPTGTKIIVASDLGFHLHFIEEFQEHLWQQLAGACGILLIAAWLAVRLGHRPLHHISENIRSITAEELGQRIDPSTVPSDLVELVTSFNDMVSRMEDVFLRLSHVSDDIAHELRTPVTAMTTQTQVALSKSREADEYREVLYSNLEEFERMTKMINEMLWLARTDSGLLKPDYETVDSKQELQKLFEYLDAWAEERAVSLVLKGECSPVQCDRSLFRRAVSNLLSNAIHHADKGSEIIVHLDQNNVNLEIVIENSGENIPAGDIPKLFDRFHRVDPSRQRPGGTGGSGLGLSIVQAIVLLHGGRISVTSVNQRTKFHLEIPLEPV